MILVPVLNLNERVNMANGISPYLTNFELVFEDEQEAKEIVSLLTYVLENAETIQRLVDNAETIQRLVERA